MSGTEFPASSHFSCGENDSNDSVRFRISGETQSQFLVFRTLPAGQQANLNLSQAHADKTCQKPDPSPQNLFTPHERKS